jgi:HlyD family secretion protein
MKSTDEVRHFGETAHHRESDTNSDGVGPQGAALILELQRLRRAFEHQEAGDPFRPKADRTARRGTRPAKRQKSSKPRRRSKGKMGRVIDVCLGQIGLASGGRAARRNEKIDEPAYLQTRGLSPTIAPEDPAPIDFRQTSLEYARSNDKNKLMQLECPSMELPPAALDVTPATMARQLIVVCRSGMESGLAFLLNSAVLRDDTPGVSLTVRASNAFEQELRTGLRVLLVALAMAGGWAALVPLAGAVVVPGNLVVQSNVKTIQHPTGGVVAEIAVHNGQRVGSGDLLLRLDATQARTSLQIVSKQLNEMRAKIGRLVAERDKLAELQVPAELSAQSNDATIKKLLASEELLFKERANARRGQTDLLQSRISQLGEEIAGLDAQVASKTKQLELIAGELSGVQELYDKRLVPLARLTALQRETARIEGERGQLVWSIAETRSKIGEAQLQIMRIDQDFRTDVVKELGESRAKEAELVERGVAAQDLLDRIEIRAPTSGVVHQLSVHTVGGVIRAGDSAMEIVPDSDDLQIEARLQPNEIDQVRTGQRAFVRFSAFNQRVTPQLTGTVSYVSADTSHDQQANMPYFTVRVALSDDEIRRLAGLQLVPGMPAEVFMQTGSRTMMNYLLKPIADQMRRAFVEQ